MAQAGESGSLYGVGVGPGDPELLTIKAYKVLRQCPVIAYPKRREGSKSYALEIVELYVDTTEKEMLGLVFPMTKDPDVLAQQWQQTVDCLWEHLCLGQDVAFVTEGDPMLYSTFIHMSRLVQQCHPQVPIRSIPGVSSMNAAASAFGVPLADGNQTIAIVPATGDAEKTRRMLLDNDCVVFIKVAKVLDFMIPLLSDMGLLDKAMVGTRVTSKDEVLWRNVSDVYGTEMNYLTLMVVKK
ncbi:precorrin-2 C(20)-methyltransferase [Alicyclobacillaceae bacterium I2511]|nr:precorrin-2 C(20)-methyltransferase [Alicyclobacillaceae bacterium I2511]